METIGGREFHEPADNGGELMPTFDGTPAAVVTFTYDLSHVDAAKVLISKVRLEIGDTVAGAGVRPDGSNLSDEEISFWLTEEADVYLLAAARACEALSRMWNPVTNVTVGPRKEEFSKVSGEWQTRADSLRSQYAYSSNDRPTVYVL